MLNIILIGGLGAPEIIIILVIVLLLFGGRKIPELMRGLGRGVKEFKEASTNDNDGKTVRDDEPKAHN
ncbi:MAG TPA: twin-arginine translocase TatA/TatE family subunit [Sphingobacteriaceae bacterium]|nr:twin-arginine translocase TatA/TatE family subunit [Sphingobacteriaceae bacterium]